MDAIQVTVSNRIRVPVPGPDSDLARALKDRFTHDNPSYQTWKRFKFGAPPPKQIETWKPEGRGRFVSIPRGGFEDLGQLLDERETSMSVVDETTFPDADRLALATPLWAHQEELIRSFWQSPSPAVFRTCLWRSPQGSGKTQTVLALAAGMKTRTLVITPTGNLFDQWCVRVQRELGIRPGVVRGPKREIRRITIATHQTLAGCCDELASEFGLVVMDEVQRAAADTVQHVCDAFRARYRLGVSADERRADKKEFLIHDVFGPVAHEVKRDELEGTGEIVDVEVRVVPTEFRADWWVAIAPKDKTSDRQRAQATRDRVQERHRLLADLTGDRERNELVHWCAAQALALGEQVVVLTDRREHCQVLHSGFASRSVPSGLFIGGTDYRDQFTLTLAGLNRGDVRVGVGTYQAIGVGFEAHRRLAVGVCASPCVNGPGSRMQFNQYRGRFARSAPGKQRGTLYYLLDRHVFGLAPLQLLLRWNKSVSVLDDGRWVSGRHYLRHANQK